MGLKDRRPLAGEASHPHRSPRRLLSTPVARTTAPGRAAHGPRAPAGVLGPSHLRGPVRGPTTRRALPSPLGSGLLPAPEVAPVRLRGSQGTPKAGRGDRGCGASPALSSGPRRPVRVQTRDADVGSVFRQGSAPAAQAQGSYAQPEGGRPCRLEAAARSTRASRRPAPAERREPPLRPPGNPIAGLEPEGLDPAVGRPCPSGRALSPPLSRRAPCRPPEARRAR